MCKASRFALLDLKAEPLADFQNWYALSSIPIEHRSRWQVRLSMTLNWRLHSILKSGPKARADEATG